MFKPYGIGHGQNYVNLMQRSENLLQKLEEYKKIFKLDDNLDPIKAKKSVELASHVPTVVPLVNEFSYLLIHGGHYYKEGHTPKHFDSLNQVFNFVRKNKKLFSKTKSFSVKQFDNIKGHECGTILESSKFNFLSEI
tara:strand:- start:119 stop:529 length:411 start_codon:yes stop_codon:yes gene_type:complete